MNIRKLNREYTQKPISPNQEWEPMKPEKDSQSVYYTTAFAILLTEVSQKI